MTKETIIAISLENSCFNAYKRCADALGYDLSEYIATFLSKQARRKENEISMGEISQW